MQLSNLIKVLEQQLQESGDILVYLENPEFCICKPVRLANLEIRVIDNVPAIVIAE